MEPFGHIRVTRGTEANARGDVERVIYMKSAVKRMLTLVTVVCLVQIVASISLPPVRLAEAASCTPSGLNTVCTFSYTGMAESWTVPSCVTQISVVAYGAQGGSGAAGGYGG